MDLFISFIANSSLENCLKVPRFYFWGKMAAEEEIVESLYCTTEANTTLYLNYTGIKRRKKKHSKVFSQVSSKILIKLGIAVLGKN